MDTREQLRERLAVEGKKFSGHVTHGSLDAQMVVVDEAITKAVADVLAELLASMRDISGQYSI